MASANPSSYSPFATATTVQAYNYMRIKVTFNGTRQHQTLMGVDPHHGTVDQIIGKVCNRFKLDNETSSALGLYVQYGPAWIQVYEVTDLKDGDHCALLTDVEASVARGESVPSDHGCIPVTIVSSSSSSVMQAPVPPSSSSSIRAPSLSLVKKEEEEEPPASNKATATMGDNEDDWRLAYPLKTVVAVQWDDDRYYEATIERHGVLGTSKKNKRNKWAYLNYEAAGVRGWYDLNRSRHFVVSDDTVVTTTPKTEEEKWLLRRVEVKSDNCGDCEGTVTKVRRATDCRFVFIKYDDGEQCWSDRRLEKDLAPLDDSSTEEASEDDGKGTSVGDDKQESEDDVDDVDDVVEVDDSFSEDDDDDEDLSTQHMAKKQRKEQPAFSKGRMQEQDTQDTIDEEMTDAMKANANIRNEIQKLLKLGFYNDSTQKEKECALLLSQKLIKSHNISQVLIIKEQQQQGIRSKLRSALVEVKNDKHWSDTATQKLQWYSKLQTAVNFSFDTKSFHIFARNRPARIVFYGIDPNTQLAAFAFTAMANYKPLAKKSAVSSSFFAMGTAQKFQEAAENAKWALEDTFFRKLERARLNESQGDCYDESDEEKDGQWECFRCSKMVQSAAAYQWKAAQALGRASPQSAAAKVQELEKEADAAILLAKMIEKIQEEVLKERGIKLH